MVELLHSRGRNLDMFITDNENTCGILPSPCFQIRFTGFTTLGIV